MNPFVEEEEEDHVDDDALPLDLDAFIGGELTPLKLVAILVRKAALKAAAAAGEGDEKNAAIIVAEAMASQPPSSSRVSGKRSVLSLPAPSLLLLETIIGEFER